MIDWLGKKRKEKKMGCWVASSWNHSSHEKGEKLSSPQAKGPEWHAGSHKLLFSQVFMRLAPEPLSINDLQGGQHYGTTGKPLLVLPPSLQIQFPANAPAKSVDDAPRVGFLPPIWESWMEFLAPDFNLVQSWLWGTFCKWTSSWKICLCLPFLSFCL